MHNSHSASLFLRLSLFYFYFFPSYHRASECGGSQSVSRVLRKTTKNNPTKRRLRRRPNNAAALKPRLSFFNTCLRCRTSTAMSALEDVMGIRHLALHSFLHFPRWISFFSGSGLLLQIWPGVC